MLINRIRAEVTEGTLYHYCGSETLLSILKNRTIRFSDVTLLNDGQEGAWGYHVFEVAADRLSRPENIPKGMPNIPTEFFATIRHRWLPVGLEYFMGHQRLGTLPRSRLWRDVVELIDHRADVKEVAAATSLAAEQSMIDASQDAAVQHAFYLMAKIPLAAREHDFEAALSRLGMPIQKGPSLTDLVCGLMEAIDARTRQVGSRSDYGEIAQLSAAEALYAVIGRETRDLFGVDAVATKSAIAGFATVKQFAVLSRDFFARLTRRHINYYLSRELSQHVGPGRRFPSVREHRLFEDALDLHCREATRVIKEYSGEWLSKHNYEGGIDPAKAGRFVTYASKKIRAELRHRRNALVTA